MSGGSPSSPPPSRPRVLVVDDEDVLRRWMARALKSAGFLVVEATGATQAVEFLADFAFDAVVTEVLMPGMSGIELLRLARQRDLDLPVLLISGASEVESASEA